MGKKDKNYIFTLEDGAKYEICPVSQEKLQKMIGKTPEELTGDTLKLYNAIMKIADENDILRKQIADMDSEYQKLLREKEILEVRYAKKQK